MSAAGSPTTSVLNVHGSQTHESRNLALKTFVIFVIFLGAVAITTGVLALLASKGMLPNGLNSISKLSEMGVVYSVVSVAGGTAIFLVGLAAWTCHLYKSRIRQI